MLCTAIQKVLPTLPINEKKNSAFYLTPLKKPKGDIWFGTTPIGHNTLSKTLKGLCDATGIGGFKQITLCKLLVLQDFQSRMDEQLIMVRTGNRSIDGIPTYKRVSNKQKEDILHVFISATNCNILHNSN